MPTVSTDRDPINDLARTQAGDPFEALRPRLFGIAYRMLGLVADAEDVVQEAYLKWHQADRREIRTPEAWLVSVTTRLSIDRIRKGEAERRAYSGEWLPEPIVSMEAGRAAVVASELSTAFLLLLQRLSPEERAAFLLREVFDVGYGEIARIVEKSEEAARQVVSRARRRVREGRPRFEADPATQERLLRRFLDALAAEDATALLAVLAPDANLVSDGGGRVTTVRRTIAGRDRLSRYFLISSRKFGPFTHRVAWIGGGPGLLTFWRGRLYSAMSVESDGVRITNFFRVVNPEKLGRLAAKLPS